MSLTQVDTSSYNTGIHVSAWQQKLLMQAGEKIFFENLSGPPGGGMPIIRQDDLTIKPGGIVNVPMQRRLTGAGVTGNTALSGSEEAMVFDNLPVTPLLHRNAAASHIADQKKTLHNLKMAAQIGSAIWMAEQIDNAVFAELNGQTANRIYGGAGTAKNDLTSGMKMTAALLSKVRAKAKSVHIKPLIIGGREWYIVVMHPFQAYDLRTDSTWLAAQTGAEVRGRDNPVLAMAMGAYQGMLIFENDRVEYGEDAGSGGNVEYAIAHLIGSDAVAFAWSMYPTYIQEIRDYGAVIGAGSMAYFAAEAAVFNSVPVGHVPIMTAAADPT